MRLQEIAKQIAKQEESTRGIVERCSVLEVTIKRIIENVQQQNVFNMSASATMSGLVEES